MRPITAPRALALMGLAMTSLYATLWLWSPWPHLRFFLGAPIVVALVLSIWWPLGEG